jgi:hypothetical protein
VLSGDATPQAPTNTSAAQAPPPLTKVDRPPDGKFFIGIDLVPDGTTARIFETATSRLTQVLPGTTYWSVAAAPDGHSFYVSRYHNDARCESELLKVALRDDGKVRSLTPVARSQAAGKHFSDLSLSPDGRSIALTSRQLTWNGKHCVPSMNDYELVVLDLATGTRRSWPHSTDSGSWGQAELAWSFDGKHVVFRWPLENLSPEGTALRMLDPSAPAGDLEAASKPVPLAGKRNQLTLITSGTPGGGAYSGWLTVYQGLGGDRILAYRQESVADRRTRLKSHEPSGQGATPTPCSGPCDADADVDSYRGVLLEISLTTGMIREVPR